MKIVYLGNNRVGWQVLSWLKEQGEDIVGLVTHPPHKQKFGKEIEKTANLAPEYVFDGSKLRLKETVTRIKKLNPDIGISILFDYILRPEFLHCFPHGVINLHPSFLPYNRGQYPNVWSIIDGTPAGVTLHYIDERIDTGDIISQYQVVVEAVDTGETLYRKLEHAALSLFQDTWPLIKSKQASRRPQESGGSIHRTSDVENVDRIDLERIYTARELINILRARTFPPYRGAYFEVNGKRVYMRLQLEHEDTKKE